MVWAPSRNDTHQRRPLSPSPQRLGVYVAAQSAGGTSKRFRISMPPSRCVRGTKFRFHALGNCFIAVADREFMPRRSLTKRLADQARHSGVTEDYVVDSTVNQLRKPAQPSADQIDDPPLSRVHNVRASMLQRWTPSGTAQCPLRLRQDLHKRFRPVLGVPEGKDPPSTRVTCSLYTHPWPFGHPLFL